MADPDAVVIQALRRILRPLVRILIRQGITADAGTDLIRRTFVEVAERDFRVANRAPSTSRISVLTGLSRKEVARLRKADERPPTAVDAYHNRAARVISGWLRDPDFLDRKGDPAALAFEGERGFVALVKRHSGDMPARAVADELLRVGAIEYSPYGELRLTARGYVPGEGDHEKLQILGTDVRDLIETIDHNLVHPPEQARFQRKVAYDNLPAECAGEFRQLAARLGQQVLEQLNDWLARRDRDTGGRGRRGARRVRLGLGIVQFEGPSDEAPPTRRRKR